jgi:uncharacterized membrane protein
MAALLLNFRNTIIVSAILALVFIVGYGMDGPDHFGMIFWQAVLRWAHVVSGILWIGLLYYFNFVQIRKMPDIPAELKPAVSKYIAPEALFWFRYAALSTVVFGLLISWNRGYIAEALTLGLYGGFDPAEDTKYAFLGAGMWLALIMAFNVWFVIWPNQKIALGLVESNADAKAKAGKTATLFSRTNTLLSLPMLVTMTMSQTVFG